MLNQHKTIRANIEKFNKINALNYDLDKLIGNKKEARILDVGSGAFNTIGHIIPGKNIRVVCCDNQDFTSFYKKYNVFPLYPIEYQNMEDLTYPDDSFDIVNCDNALDHTKDALRAVSEMIRVCKLGGYVRINCHLHQMDTGHKHFWNAKEDGVFESKRDKFDLKDLGFKITYIDRGGETRYNQIIAILQKV